MERPVSIARRVSRVRPVPLEKMKVTDKLVFVLVTDASVNSQDSLIASIHEAMQLSYPKTQFEIIDHRLLFEITRLDIIFVPSMPQLGSFIQDSINLFVMQSNVYDKLCRTQPLRYDEIRSYHCEYGPIDNIEDHFRFYPVYHYEKEETVLIAEWIRDAFVFVPPAPEPSPVIKVYDLPLTTVHPEMLLHIHHPCRNARCMDAPAIIKEAVGEHIEVRTHIGSTDIGCFDLPTLRDDLFVRFPSLCAMSKETYQKLLRKEEITVGEIDVFRVSEIDGLRRIHQSHEFSVANIRKWLRMEKEPMA